LVADDPLAWFAFPDAARPLKAFLEEGNEEVDCDNQGSTRLQVTSVA